MTVIDLGVLTREAEEMAPVHHSSSPVVHGWEARHRRRADRRGLHVLAKLSGLLAFVVVATLTTAGALTRTLIWPEVVVLAMVLAVLGFLVVKR